MSPYCLLLACLSGTAYAISLALAKSEGPERIWDPWLFKRASPAELRGLRSAYPQQSDQFRTTCSVMKRDNQGNPVQVTHRWNRPPLSCLPCREKKRRCDRALPCSNCVLRDIACNYAGQSPETLGPSAASQASTASSGQVTGAQPVNSAEVNNR